MGMTPQPTVVGILGGMGPAATADFYAKLIAATPATRDQDHLPVIIWADPRVPDRTAALLGTGPDPTPALRRGIEGLAAAGATLLVVACNTAHAFVPAIAADVGIELISIIDTAAASLQDTVRPGARVGLLATEGTISSRLYHRACEATGYQIIVPDGPAQRSVNAVIASVKANDRPAADLREDLLAVIFQLQSGGAEAVVAGCTEIVLGLGTGYEEAIPIPVIDPAAVTARELVRRAFHPASY